MGSRYSLLVLLFLFAWRTCEWIDNLIERITEDGSSNSNDVIPAQGPFVHRL